MDKMRHMSVGGSEVGRWKSCSIVLMSEGGGTSIRKSSDLVEKSLWRSRPQGECINSGTSARDNLKESNSRSVERTNHD